MRRRSLLLALIIGIGAGRVPMPASAATTATVELRDNYFDPVETRIGSGDSVQWLVIDGGHSIRSSDEVAGKPIFEFPSGSGQLAAGDTAVHTFEAAGKFTYYCEVHPGSMRGSVYVDYVPPPDVRVPEDHTTIAAAAAAAEAGQTISVAPGVYRERVIVRADDVTIRGRGGTPDAVVVDGGGVDDTSIAVFAAGVAIENLSVRQSAGDAIFAKGAERLVVRDVIIGEVGRSGVHLVRSRGGAVHRVRLDGAGGAAVVVEDCHSCGIAITDVRISQSGAGIRIVNVGHVQLDSSTVSSTGPGVELISSAREGSTFQRGAVLRGNTLDSSATGILVRGSWDTLIVGNDVAGETAIEVTGVPFPAVAVEVRDNQVAGRVDLRWDLAGTACFSDNTRPGGNPPSSSPPELQRLFPCERPRTPVY